MKAARHYLLDIPDVSRNHTLLFFPLKIFSVREIYSDSLFEMFINIFFRAGESANFLGLRLLTFFQTAPASAPAPAPDFFSQATPAQAPAPGFFFKRLRLRLQGAKNTRLRLRLRLLTIG